MEGVDLITLYSFVYAGNVSLKLKKEGRKKSHSQPVWGWGGWASGGS